jgi:hypothetical protein
LAPFAILSDILQVSLETADQKELKEMTGAVAPVIFLF